MFRDPRRSLRRRSNRNIQRSRKEYQESCAAELYCCWGQGWGRPGPHSISPPPLGSPHYGQRPGEAVRDD